MKMVLDVYGVALNSFVDIDMCVYAGFCSIIEHTKTYQKPPCVYSIGKQAYLTYLGFWDDQSGYFMMV